MLASRIIGSPVGKLTLVAGDAGLRAVLWGGNRVDGAALGDEPAQATTEARAQSVAHAHLDTAEAQLGEYFAGTRRTFDIALDPVGTAFQREAWMALRKIPYGETISYGEQARRLGDAKRSRAVGAANGRNPLSIVVPCHRVVGADGKLTGFGGGLPAKAWLLDHELSHRML